jgi:phosphoesterase RecJ-like protein
MDTIEEAVNTLMTHDNFVLATHLNPDGDALGSLMGLGLAILSTGRRAEMIMPHPVPSAFQFMPGTRQVRQTPLHPAGFDVGIALDCTDLNRLGDEPRKMLRNSGKLVNIDHHISNSFFGDINVVDAQASATGEIIYDILLKAKITVTKEIATDLFTALVTDTGSFQHQNTTPKCFRTAAGLLECGALHSIVHQHLYEQKTPASLRLLSRALESLSLNENGTLAWITVSRDLLSACGASAEDSEGMTDYLQSLKGVEAGILFKEINRGEIKVSFRSKQYLDVNRLAAYFGGGGHARAAGCTIIGKIKDVEQIVIRKTDEQLSLKDNGGHGR